ncbi:hypothetical protein IEQ34_005090 [Dendrobium chrysotoxum]|uniref:Uncharacterized protein n=1 Tax=Dendrobium chrysotoxum TaxID=161865 RepID=A0AAV7HAU5_DENCH|nr:hypothetical protein IEQ34_005090 [Dendrobium chrysotoxum]
MKLNEEVVSKRFLLVLDDIQGEGRNGIIVKGRVCSPLCLAKVWEGLSCTDACKGSPLTTKFIGGVLKDNLNERDWRTVLESKLFGQNSIDFVLGLSYKVLPNHPQNCFTSVDPHNSKHV